MKEVVYAFCWALIGFSVGVVLCSHYWARSLKRYEALLDRLVKYIRERDDELASIQADLLSRQRDARRGKLS